MPEVSKVSIYARKTVNGLADRFSEIDHVVEHEFNVRKKVLFKAGEKWSIRHPGETAENPQFPAEGKKEGFRPRDW